MLFNDFAGLGSAAGVTGGVNGPLVRLCFSTISLVWAAPLV
jgi:hypothetical protein